MGSRPRTSAGQRYGRLLVLQRAGLASNKVVRWLCLCDCGTEKEITGSNLRRGITMSCGCLRREMKTTHGEGGGVRSPEYNAWRAILDRCCNPKHKSYASYGGRGILMCDRWRHSFAMFLEDMGRRPHRGYTIERTDVNGNYERSNCVWASPLEQQNNRRNNFRITWAGKTMTASQWERELGLGHGQLSSRIKKFGWSIDRAMTAPKRGHLARSLYHHNYGYVREGWE